MSMVTGRLIEVVDGVSLAGVGGGAEGAGVKSMPVSPNGLSSELLEVLAALAAEKVRCGGLQLMGEGGILPELAQHLMQAAVAYRRIHGELATLGIKVAGRRPLPRVAHPPP